MPRKATQRVIKIARWRMEFGVNCQSWMPYESKRRRRNSCAGKDNPRYKNATNITVKPAGGLGREAEPGRMMFPSSAEIRPRLLVAAGEASGEAFVVTSAIALGTVLLEATPVTAAELFFFTILEYA
jgi:hypothetical protein